MNPITCVLRCLRGVTVSVLVLVCSLASSPTPAQAQLDADLGIQVGRTFATVSGERAWENPNRRTGWMLAGTARIPLASRLMVRANAAYVQKGARETIATEAGTATVTMQTDYIEFPVVLDAQWPASRMVTARAFAGPAVGFNIKAEHVANRPLTGVPPLRDHVRRTEFSAVLGMGLDLHLNYQTLLVDAQYQFGLTDVIDDPDAHTVRHRGLSVAMGIAF